MTPCESFLFYKNGSSILMQLVLITLTTYIYNNNNNIYIYIVTCYICNLIDKYEQWIGDKLKPMRKLVDGKKIKLIQVSQSFIQLCTGYFQPIATFKLPTYFCEGSFSQLNQFKKLREDLFSWIAKFDTHFPFSLICRLLLFI